MSTRKGAARIPVRVQPRASRSEIVGERDGVLIVRLTAPPVGGEANEALCRLLARRLRVGRRSVEVVQGGRSREKLVEVTGYTEASLRKTLHDLL